MKTVVVLFGSFANQRVQMEDADAATAVTDKWAVAADTFKATGIPTDIQAGLNVGLYGKPASLKAWEAKVNPPVGPDNKPIVAGPAAITAISKANPAVVTVGAGDIGRFANGMVVTIAGVTGTGWTVCNGSKTVAGKTGNTFTIGTDTLAATGTTPTALGTVTPPAA